MQRHTAGTIKIVPVVVEPCDWQSTPLGGLNALPKDGKPVSEWQNINTAFLDVIQNLRKLGKVTATAGVELQAPASPVPLINSFWDLIDLYAKYHNDHVKHDSRVEVADVNTVLYLSAVFIHRLLKTLI